MTRAMMTTATAAAALVLVLVLAAATTGCGSSGFTGTWIDDEGMKRDVQGVGDKFALVKHGQGGDAVVVFDGSTVYRDVVMSEQWSDGGARSIKAQHKAEPATKNDLVMDTFWRVHPLVDLIRAKDQTGEVVCGKKPTEYKACMPGLGCSRVFVDDKTDLVLKVVADDGKVLSECTALKIGKVSSKAFDKPWRD